jgi:hypothetical protein
VLGQGYPAALPEHRAPAVTRTTDPLATPGVVPTAVLFPN